MVAQVLDGTATKTSLVLETAPADSATAERYFTAKLGCETDPADVWADMQAGIGGFVVVDARSREAYAEGHVPGAISLPHREMTAETVAALPAGQVAIVYCWGPGCNAGAKGGRRLAVLGVPVKEMIGGYEYWVKDGNPVE